MALMGRVGKVRTKAHSMLHLTVWGWMPYFLAKESKASMQRRGTQTNFLKDV